MKIKHPNAFRDRVRDALRHGTARVDRGLDHPHMQPCLVVRTAGGPAFWIIFQPRTETRAAGAWVLAVKDYRPGQPTEAVHGAGCEGAGFALHTHCTGSDAVADGGAAEVELVRQLLALAPPNPDGRLRPVVVRGEARVVEGLMYI